MSKILMDTSVIVGFLRGNSDIVEKISNYSGDLCTSVICVAELYEGIYRVKRRKSAERALLEFIRRLDGVEGITLEVARKFGEIRTSLKSKGVVIEDLDILIAATCVVYEYKLATLNRKHFERVKGLKLSD